MHISRRVCFTAAIAAALTGVLPASGASAASTTPAVAMPNVTTYDYSHTTGYVPIQSWNCTPATHGGINNPELIEAIGNNCNTRVWLHGTAGQSYCVSPLTFDADFDARWQVANLQVTSNTAGC